MNSLRLDPSILKGLLAEVTTYFKAVSVQRAPESFFEIIRESKGAK